VGNLQLLQVKAQNRATTSRNPSKPTRCEIHASRVRSAARVSPPVGCLTSSHRRIHFAVSVASELRASQQLLVVSSSWLVHRELKTRARARETLPICGLQPGFRTLSIKKKVIDPLLASCTPDKKIKYDKVWPWRCLFCCVLFLVVNLVPAGAPPFDLAGPPLLTCGFRVRARPCRFLRSQLLPGDRLWFMRVGRRSRRRRYR